MSEKELSIIIVNYNTRTLLRNCLHSVVKTTKGLEYEIIVVDNGSSDGSVEMLITEFPKIIRILNKENLGFARANNMGIKIASGKNILLLNSDTIVLNGSLSGVVRFIESKSDVGIVGCKVMNKDGSLQYSCYHNPGFLSELVFFTKSVVKNFWDPVTYYKYMGYWDHSSIRTVDCISGCFFLVKKQVFDQIGFLDENIFMYYEDTDFCARVKKNGSFKIMYYPLAGIIHLKGKSGFSDLPESVIKIFQAARYYFRKQHGERRETIFAAGCAACWIIEYLLFMPFSFLDKFRRKRLLIVNLLKIGFGFSSP